MLTEKALLVTEKFNISPNHVVLPVKAIAIKDAARPVSFITENEVNLMADAARTMRNGERNELFILILFQCCLRVSEAVHLTPKHKLVIDGDKHVLAVIGKGGKPRLVAIPEKLSYHLGDYASRNAINGESRFFPITRFRGLQIIKECANHAGINRRIYCHLLRHGGAVTRLSKTGNPKSLQMFLGHADIKMTMRYLSTLQAIQSIETESGVKFDR